MAGVSGQAGHLFYPWTFLRYSIHTSATVTAGCSLQQSSDARFRCIQLRNSRVLKSKGLSSVSHSNSARDVPPYSRFGESWCGRTSLIQTWNCGRIARVMFSIQPEKVGPGQESVWDYPRPPRLEPVKESIKVVFNGDTIVESTTAYRVLETSHPPVYYVPTVDVKMEYISRAPGSSFCEWKGNATWWTLSVGAKTAEKVAWSYENPTTTFLPIKGFLAFYAGPMDACFVGEEKAQPQPGNFYGGWVTSTIVGPFKGGPGSWGW